MSQSISSRSRAGRWVLLLAAVGGLILCFTALSRLMGQLALALLLTALALPLEKRLEKRCSRALSAVAAVGLLLLGVLGFLVLLVPSMIAQLSLVIGKVPKLIALVQKGLKRLQENEWLAGLAPGLLRPDSAPEKLGALAGSNLPCLLSSIAAGTDVISRAFLSSILAYYFLRGREVFCYRLSLWIPASHRRQMLIAFKEMRREAGGCGRGQLLVAASVAGLTALGLLIVGVRAWLVLGLLMGICELIPYTIRRKSAFYALRTRKK